MTGEQGVRVGVIGTGFGARVVAPMFASTDGCEVVDVVSSRDGPAVAELCARRDLDLISVDSPPFMQLEHVRRAVGHGHAVLCQKPFGLNASEAEEMTELAADAGVLNLVTYEFRIHPVRTRMREILAAGAVGDIEHVQWTSFAGIWRTPRPYSWSFDAARGGGWIRVHGSHNIDFIRWTFGEILDATAQVRTTIKQRPDADGNLHDSTGEDGFIMTLRTDRDISIVFDATATAAVDRPVRLTIIGSEGVLEVVSENVHEIGGRILLHTAAGTSELFYKPAWGDSSSHDNSAMAPFGILVRDAVRKGVADPVMATFADGLATARVMDQLTPERLGQRTADVSRMTGNER